MSEYPVLSVHIPPVLKPLTGGRDEVTASGATVGEVLQAVGRVWPAFSGRVLCGDGSLAAGLSVYRNGTPLVQGLATPVEPEEVLSLVATGEVSCSVPARPLPVFAAGDAAVISLGE
ncbi:hypothetical protein VX159_15670 [Dechloromonas sp. ZY10]|uniref:hypothetical protein n=1 Tax=Dechloromonas aquae TaxID=2664436 RepID=UPI003527B5A0